MSLFTKNPNETAFTGGKKHWVDVIKNTDINGNFIWRQPEEDFNTNSTLIVMPGEEALFVKGGTIEQVFQSGTYKLDTQNYPFISRLRNMFSGGISTFNCVVYFIRKTHSMELKWGTVSPLSVYDRQFAQLTGITSAELKLRARGSYKLQIENGAKLLTKMMGNGFSALSPDDVEDYCSEQFQEEIRSSLTDALNKTESGLIGVESRLKEFSGVLSPILAEIVIDYGLALVNFSISALELDEESKAQRRTYDEAILSGSRDVIAAQAKRASVDALGRELYQFDRGADILESLAENPGAGGVASAGAGLGMGLAAGNIFSGMAQSIFTPLNPQVQNIPAQPQGSGRFATKTAGTSVEQAASTGNTTENDPVIALKKLKEMLDMGLITQDVYNAKQSEILSRM